MIPVGQKSGLFADRRTSHSALNMFKWLDYFDAVYVHLTPLVSLHSSVQSQVCGAESSISIAHLRMVGCLLTPLGERLIQRLNEHLVILLLFLDRLQVRSGKLLK